MSFANLLEAESQTAGGGIPSYVMWIVLVAIIAIFVVWMVISGRKRKNQEQEFQDKVKSVKPGNKVKTIGGICGIVVEIDPEENTFVLETGSVESGKSYIKFDKQAIFDTDAIPESKAAGTAETAETPEAPAEQTASGAKEEAAEQSAQAEEQTPEEKPE